MIVIWYVELILDIVNFVDSVRLMRLSEVIADPASFVDSFKLERCLEVIVNPVLGVFLESTVCISGRSDILK